MALNAEFLELIDRDPSIPGLSTLLDPDGLRACVNDASPVEITSAELTYLRYKPWRNCVAQYTLHSNDETVTAYAKAYGPDIDIKLRKAPLRLAQAGPIGEGRFILPGVGIEVAVFPNDAKLPALQLLGDADAKRRLWQRLLPKHPEFWRLEPVTLAYKPERRYVGLFREGSSGVVLKLYSPSGFNTALNNARRPLSGEGWRTLPLRAASKAKAALVFDFSHGTNLREAIDDTGELHTRVGRALAEFHTQSIRRTNTRTVAEEISELELFCHQLDCLAPAIRARVARLRQVLECWLRSRVGRCSLVHGDFYDKQLLVDNGELLILDLDRAHRGDPIQDLACFIAHLIRDAASGRLAEAVAMTRCQAFVEGYRSSAHEPPLRDLQVATAAALLRLSHHPFRYAEPHWVDSIENLLTIAEALANGEQHWLEGRP